VDDRGGLASRIYCSGFRCLALWIDLKVSRIRGASMSRRGNCHDNAVAESFYANLKKRKSDEVSIKPVQMHGLLRLTISKCYITQNADIHITTEWRQRSTSSDILRTRKVSSKVRPYHYHQYPGNLLSRLIPVHNKSQLYLFTRVCQKLN